MRGVVAEGVATLVSKHVIIGFLSPDRWDGSSRIFLSEDVSRLPQPPWSGRRGAGHSSLYRTLAPQRLSNTHGGTLMPAWACLLGRGVAALMSCSPIPLVTREEASFRHERCAQRHWRRGKQNMSVWVMNRSLRHYYVSQGDQTFTTSPLCLVSTKVIVLIQVCFSVILFIFLSSVGVTSLQCFQSYPQLPFLFTRSVLITQGVRRRVAKDIQTPIGLKWTRESCEETDVSPKSPALRNTLVLTAATPQPAAHHYTVCIIVVSKNCI